LVVSGVTQDKPTANAIVHWSGVGINLGKRQPEVKKLSEAIDKVLGDEKYKKKAVELSQHYKKYDVGQVVDGLVREVVRKWRESR